MTGYNVYRKFGSDGSYVVINATVVDAVQFTDETVTLGTRYYYVVRSVDGDGTESVDSESMSIVQSALAAALSGSSSSGGVEDVLYLQ